MITISAFADEIGPTLQEQIEGCQDNGVMCIDVRKIDDCNVSEFTEKQARAYRRQIDDNGFTIPCIGSPIGKIRVSDDFEKHLDLLKNCFTVAHAFGTRKIRIFSFYASSDETPVTEERAAVMTRMERMIKAAEQADMVLMHENEKRIYGARPEQVLDLLDTFPSPNFKAIFDPANYVEEDIRPYDQGWQQGLDSRTDFFHIKDKIAGAAGCVPAGQGDGQFAELFADLANQSRNYYMTLEPHLRTAGQFEGFSGLDKFSQAAEALKAVCRQANLQVR